MQIPLFHTIQNTVDETDPDRSMLDSVSARNASQVVNEDDCMMESVRDFSAPVINDESLNNVPQEKRNRIIIPQAVSPRQNLNEASKADHSSSDNEEAKDCKLKRKKSAEEVQKHSRNQIKKTKSIDKGQRGSAARSPGKDNTRKSPRDQRLGSPPQTARGVRHGFLQQAHDKSL